MTMVGGGSAAALRAAAVAPVPPAAIASRFGVATGDLPNVAIAERPPSRPDDGGSGRPAGGQASPSSPAAPPTAAAPTAILAQSLAEGQAGASPSSRQVANAYARHAPVAAPVAAVDILSPLPVLASGRTVDLTV